MNELEIVQHRQIKGLSLFFNTVDYRTPHIHPEWELIWVLDNDLSVTCGKEQFLVSPGQMILFNPNEPHEFHKAGNSCTFLCLQISPSVLPAMLLAHVDGKLLHQHLSANELKSLRKQLAGIMNAYLQKEEHFGLFCVGQSILLLHRLITLLPSHLLSADETQSIHKRNARLKRLICFVDENYMHKILLADFAEAEGCSLSYLSRFIKNTMNQNFQEYVTSVRFNRACQMIAVGEKKLLDVCMESGFSDYRYFSREFKRQYGMTPEEYRGYTKKLHLESAAVRHSLHSAERFYSKEESLTLLNKYLQQ